MCCPETNPAAAWPGDHSTARAPDSWWRSVLWSGRFLRAMANISPLPLGVTVRGSEEQGWGGVSVVLSISRTVNFYCLGIERGVEEGWPWRSGGITGHVSLLFPSVCFPWRPSLSERWQAALAGSDVVHLGWSLSRSAESRRSGVWPWTQNNIWNTLPNLTPNRFCWVDSFRTNELWREVKMKGNIWRSFLNAVS